MLFGDRHRPFEPKRVPLRCSRQRSLAAAALLTFDAPRARGARQHSREAKNGRPQTFFPLEISGVPYGIRTRVTAVKGRCPRPLDEGDSEARVDVPASRRQIKRSRRRPLALASLWIRAGGQTSSWAMA